MTEIILESQEDDDVVVANQTSIQTMTIEIGVKTVCKFRKYLLTKYHDDEESITKNRLNEFEDVLSLGIERAKKELEYPILFEEKNPRKDVMVNLGKIANELLKSPEYPKIRAVTLQPIINKIMGFRDKRTKEKYLKCIQQYIEEPKEFGLTDVSGFIDRLPNEFLNTTSSTSSS